MRAEVKILQRNRLDVNSFVFSKTLKAHKRNVPVFFEGYKTNFRDGGF